MNAHELADYLDTFWQAKIFNEAAAALRQQQTEIEALKRGNEATAILNYNKGHEDGRKLVVTPQTKLSDEEKIKMYQTWLITSNDPLVLFRAIEAKLRGEK